MVILKLLIIVAITHVVSKSMNKDITDKYMLLTTKYEVLKQAHDNLKSKSIDDKRLLNKTITNLRVTIKKMIKQDTELS